MRKALSAPVRLRPFVRQGSLRLVGRGLRLPGWHQAAEAPLKHLGLGNALEGGRVHPRTPSWAAEKPEMVLEGSEPLPRAGAG